MACGRCCCKTCFQGFLALLNAVDILSGALLLAYAIWLESKIHHGETTGTTPEAFWALPLVIGAGLVINSSLSFAGSVFQSCRCSLCLSAWLSLPLAVLEISAGITCFVRQNYFFNYLDDHQEDMNLSDANIDNIKKYFKVVAIALLVLGGLQVVRFVFSRKLRQYIHLDAREFEDLMAQEEADARHRMSQKREEIRDKYDGLRSKYRTKYSNLQVSSGQEALLGADAGAQNDAEGDLDFA
mmetsp:Transcript_5843/g.17057  ORF Transcript_5843/g.17057 Transcript_5843/m.17057 type:complete len:241 (-) Transcript_5843:197-919(-)